MKLLKQEKDLRRGIIDGRKFEVMRLKACHMKWISFTSKVTTTERRIRIFPAIVFFGVIFFPFFISPEPAGIITCKFHQLTGHSCPTCGMTRSLVALTRLNLKEAFQHHLFGPLVYVIFLVSFFVVLTEIIAGRKIRLGIKPMTIRIVSGIFLSLWIIFWIVRLLDEFNISF